MTHLVYKDPFTQIQSIFNDPFFLGFNDQFVRWEQNKKVTSSFPPYNVKKVDEDNYLVELAVAGYPKEDLEVTVDKDTLIIKTCCETNDDEEIEFLHKGIVRRNFTQTFTLGEYMVVKSASMEDGLLTVKIEREVPEEAKPKTIRIK